MNFKAITPVSLKKGDRIGIVAPARKITENEIKPAIEIFESWGLNVVTGRYLYGTSHQFSGTDKERTNDMQNMLDDDSIRAIICARGGYGTVRIIDNLNFDRFIKNPKWIVGYSDITVLHSHIQTNYNIETLHATMPVNMDGSSERREADNSLKKALFGEKLEYHFESGKNSLTGMVHGPLTGGNLSILYSLTGTPSDISTKGKILFLEDVDEYLYHIDRMIMNLKRSGKLLQAKGILIGGMTDMNDNEVSFGKSAYEIIFDNVKDLGIPVCFAFPGGHIKENMTLIMGRNAELHIETLTTLKFSE